MCYNKSMKLLSPAGNFECLKMAIYNGADEVYLGINQFNARNNIDGFNLDNIEEAVDFAHIHNVKVNLAINILFSDDEIQTALDTIVEAYNKGVDCFIIQDLGLAYLVNKNYPEIEIHASTQMGIHNLEGVKFLEQFGFKRVVLARETPLDEIKRIKENSNVEIEYFAHGALCVSFSGNCYLSSYLCNASGNRGKCKQLCRLPYTLEKNGKAIKSGYLLSAKDFNMIDKLEDLKKAGVDVIKIEGRARRPFYVATTTRQYFNALNNIKVDNQELALAFNRNYTPGYFNGNHEIISNIQNHIGIKIGKITKVIKGKKFNEVYFSSNRNLYPKSTFKIFDDDKELNTLTAYDLCLINKNLYKLTTTQEIKENTNIHLIVDAKAEDEISQFINKKVINVDIFVEKYKQIKATLYLDKPLIITGEVLEEAKNSPLSENEIISNFKKSDFFEPIVKIRILDNVFMKKQSLNQFRRCVYDKLFEYLTKQFKHNLQKIKISTNYNPIPFSNFEIVENTNVNCCSKNIIYSPEEYNLKDINSFISKCEKLGKKLYLDTPNFALKEDIESLKEIISKTNIPIIANNYYALTLNTEIVIGSGLNVFNSYTAKFYNKPIITAESSIGAKINYHYMTLRHCPMKSHIKGASCANCPYDNCYNYKMENGKKLHLKRKKLTTCTFYLTNQ